MHVYINKVKSINMYPREYRKAIHRNFGGFNSLNQTGSIAKFPMGKKPTIILWKSLESNKPLYINNPLQILNPIFEVSACFTQAWSTPKPLNLVNLTSVIVCVMP